MHPSLPITATENVITVDLFNPMVEQVVMDNLPQEIVEPAPVLVPAVNEEQGKAWVKVNSTQFLVYE